MSDTPAQETAHNEGDHHDHFRAYMIVFGALLVCTAATFIINRIFHESNPSMGMTLIMIVSIIKATLVGVIFMHLKWDWGKLYFLIVPVFILGVMMVIVLMPDLVLAWK